MSEPAMDHSTVSDASYGKEFVNNSLLGTESIKVKNDKRLDNINDDKYLDKTNKGFSKLLEHYVFKVQDTYEKNQDRKNEFYELFKNILVYSYIFLAITLVVCVLIYLIIGEAIIITAIIPPFFESLSVTIIIPKIIAEYLFNTEEEKNLSEVINNIQKHNDSVRTHQRNSSESKNTESQDNLQ